jgi:hypothetical protein
VGWEKYKAKTRQKLCEALLEELAELPLYLDTTEALGNGAWAVDDVKNKIKTFFGQESEEGK